MVKVLWPARAALFNPFVGNAFMLGFMQEIEVKEELEIKSGMEEIEVIDKTLSCDVMQANYFAGLVIESLGKGALEAGKVTVAIDQEPVLEDDISSFKPQVEDFNCRRPFPWISTKTLFLAAEVRKGEVYPSSQIGFMLPNGSRVNVRLWDLKPGNGAKVVVRPLLAKYSTKTGEICEMTESGLVKA